MVFHWPQVTFFVLNALAIVLTAALHGRPRTDRWNVGVPLSNFMFNAWLLWCGGFFGP